MNNQLITSQLNGRGSSGWRITWAQRDIIRNSSFNRQPWSRILNIFRSLPWLHLKLIFSSTATTGWRLFLWIWRDFRGESGDVLSFVASWREAQEWRGSWQSKQNKRGDNKYNQNKSIKDLINIQKDVRECSHRNFEFKKRNDFKNKTSPEGCL